MMTILYSMLVGALITNIRYYFLYRKFQSKNYVLPKTHGTYRNLLSKHFLGHTVDGETFVYCPVGRIVSWSSGDYMHLWCHFCKRYLVEDLTEESEVLR